MLRDVVVIFALGCVAAPAGAALSIPLPELGTRAAQNSALFRSQRSDIDATKLDADTAATLPNPNLSAQVGTLKSGASSGLTVETTLTQTLPFPGKLSAQRRLRELESKAREVALDKTSLALEHEATLLGFRWAQIHEETQHFRERQRRFQVIQDYLRTHPQVSPAQQVESELIQRQIRLIEKEFTELESEKAALGRDLQYLLGTDDTVLVEPRWLKASDVPERATLSPELVAKSPDARLHAARTEHARAEVVAAGKKTYPDFNLGLGYRVENVVPQNHFYYGALSLSIPLFDRGQSSVPAAKAREDSREAEKQLFQSRVRLDVQQAWSRVEAAARVVTQLPLSTAEETEAQFQKVEREFKKGRITIGLLLQADAQLHQSVAATYDAQVNLAKRLSELYLLHGSSFVWK